MGNARTLTAIIALVAIAFFAGCSDRNEGDLLDRIRNRLDEKKLFEGSSVYDINLRIKERALYLNDGFETYFYTDNRNSVIVLYAYRKKLFAAVHFEYGPVQDTKWYFINNSLFNKYIKVQDEVAPLGVGGEGQG